MQEFILMAIKSRRYMYLSGSKINNPSRIFFHVCRSFLHKPNGKRGREKKKQSRKSAIQNCKWKHRCHAAVTVEKREEREKKKTRTNRTKCKSRERKRERNSNNERGREKKIIKMDKRDTTNSQFCCSVSIPGENVRRERKAFVTQREQVIFELTPIIKTVTATVILPCNYE